MTISFVNSVLAGFIGYAIIFFIILVCVTIMNWNKTYPDERWHPPAPPAPPYVKKFNLFKMYGEFPSEYAEDFRFNHLLPAINNPQVAFVVVELDGCFCYPPSFLKAVFSGITSSKLSVFCKDEPSLLAEIEKYQKCQAD